MRLPALSLPFCEGSEKFESLVGKWCSSCQKFSCSSLNGPQMYTLVCVGGCWPMSSGFRHRPISWTVLVLAALGYFVSVRIRNWKGKFLGSFQVYQVTLTIFSSSSFFVFYHFNIDLLWIATLHKSVWFRVMSKII